jgi:site-specific DNA recombinase
VVERDNKWALEIEEREADIVRKIFRWYTEGDNDSGPMSTYGIYQKLHDLQIPSPADLDPQRWGKKKHAFGRWNQATIIRFLENETYGGVWHWQKHQERNGRQSLRPEDEWMPVSVPAIISRETWEAAVARRVHNKENALRNTKREYLLSKRVTCGFCGAGMDARVSQIRGHVIPYYGCPANGRQARPGFVHHCDLPYFRGDHVETEVWAWLQELLTHPEQLTKGLQALQAEQERQQEPLRARLQEIADKQKGLERQLERLLALYVRGDFDEKMLDKEKSRLNRETAELERERNELSGRLGTHTLTEEQIVGLQAFAAEVAQGLASSEQDFAFRRFVIETLEVSATLTVEDGEKVVYARCILGDSKRKLPGGGRHRASGGDGLPKEGMWIVTPSMNGRKIASLAVHQIQGG